MEALRLRLGLEGGDDFEAVVAAADRRLMELMAQVSRREAEERVARVMREGKLIPVQREWATALALRDPAQFDAWAASAPVVVKLGRTEAPATGGGRRREAVAASARAAWRAEPALALVCSEEAWVAQAVREANVE